ncbi:uncharacterized protein [Acropora muricata]|uniref:uncharacterized protein n=1 Tax=Acropora muricata TaxID=159855 RepID=UPI0034E40BBF
MRSPSLILILSCLAFFGCLLLCVIIIYLCVMVRRIRRDVDELIRNEGVSRKKEGDEDCERVNSRNPYAPYRVKPRHNSAIQPDPDESVIVLNALTESQSNAGRTQRLGIEYATTIQNPAVTEKQATPQQIPYQYTNNGFSPEITGNSSIQDGGSEDSQPVYENREIFSDETPAGNNNNQIIKEPIYQNTGELAVENNPEREITYTRNISDWTGKRKENESSERLKTC